MKSFFSSLFLHACIACSIVFYSSFSFLSDDIEGGKAGGREGNATGENIVTTINLSYLNNSSLNKQTTKNSIFAENTEKFSKNEKENSSHEILIKKEKKEVEIKKAPEKKEEKKLVTNKRKEKTSQKNSAQNNNTKKNANANTQASQISQASQAGTGGKGTGTGQGIGDGDAIKDVPFASGTGAGSYLSKIKSLKRPVYPELSRQAGEEGKVEIRVEVLNGKLVQSEIFTSSNYQRLDNAALKAVKKAKFNVFSGSLIIPIIFNLKN